jgi:hypothetical protein
VPVLKGVTIQEIYFFNKMFLQGIETMSLLLLLLLLLLLPPPSSSSFFFLFFLFLFFLFFFFLGTVGIFQEFSISHCWGR